MVLACVTLAHQLVEVLLAQVLLIAIDAVQVLLLLLLLFLLPLKFSLLLQKSPSLHLLFDLPLLLGLLGCGDLYSLASCLQLLVLVRCLLLLPKQVFVVLIVGRFLFRCLVLGRLRCDMLLGRRRRVAIVVVLIGGRRCIVRIILGIVVVVVIVVIVIVIVVVVLIAVVVVIILVVVLIIMHVIVPPVIFVVKVVEALIMHLGSMDFGMVHLWVVNLRFVDLRLVDLGMVHNRLRLRMCLYFRLLCSASLTESSVVFSVGLFRNCYLDWSFLGWLCRLQCL